MEKPRVIGHVVAVNGFRLKVELSPEAKSSSRATLDGVQRSVAINAFLTFDLGAGTHAIGNLSDLEARESYDPSQDQELSLELTKPRRIASVQLLGTVRQKDKGQWTFDPGITILPTLDTPAEVANPDLLSCVFGHPPQRNKPQNWTTGDYDCALELGHQTGDENTKVKASFNDLFSRPLAIVGNTGSGKSYTVASLLRSVIEDKSINANGDPHIFILDINGEYASAFLSEEERLYAREPNEAYVNGKRLSVPIWLMNTEEVCEWLSASEQTQQPVLKAWWARLKSAGKEATHQSHNDFLENAIASIADMKSGLVTLKKKEVGSHVDNIVSFCLGGEFKPDDQLIQALKKATDAHRAFNSFTTDKIDNPVDVGKALDELTTAIAVKTEGTSKTNFISVSGDTPRYFPRASLDNVTQLVDAASSEDTARLDQHLTTLRMRLRVRLADRRWAVFTNYEELGINSTKAWFKSIGFETGGSKVTILDLSMLAHEALPFVCATIGRVLLEAREKLQASERYSNPWVLVLEEAHNYARPPRQGEDRGQTLSRRAFERVAKEGRKFGLSLIVASQRPSEISPTIISQCANFFSHRLQNPDDIDHFKRIIPRQAQRLLDQVTVLASGEAIVFGSAVHVPSRVQIKIPKQEPWSATAAPYVDWRSTSSFPLSAVLNGWGVTESQSPPNKENILPEDDDEIPF